LSTLSRTFPRSASDNDSGFSIIFKRRTSFIGGGGGGDATRETCDISDWQETSVLFNKEAGCFSESSILVISISVFVVFACSRDESEEEFKNSKRVVPKSNGQNRR
jgi:hypothetical protein